jgi:hypothetical protein
MFSKKNHGAHSQYRTKKRHVKRKPFNCARVYVGNYVGGGTNEFERGISCGYAVKEGSIFIKKLKPIKVRWTTSEGQTSLLKTIVIYPKTETAVISIKNSHGSRRLKLVKVQKGERSRIFKASL